MRKTKPVAKPQEASVLGENIKLTLTVPWDTLHAQYEELLQKEMGKIQLTGFRKGKAPRSLAEGAIGKEKLIEHALRHVLPPIYEAQIQAAKLLPLVAPQITLTQADEGKDWVVEAQTATAPEIALKKYQETIKKASQTHAKTAKTDDKTKPDAQKIKDELLQAIYVALIEDIQPKIAPLLLQAEMDRQAEQLVSQISRMGISLDEYITKLGKSKEEFNQELAAMSLGALQLEFILRAIATDLKLTVSDDDIRAAFPELKSLSEKPIPAEYRPQLEAAAQREKTTAAILDIAKS